MIIFAASHFKLVFIFWKLGKGSDIPFHLTFNYSVCECSGRFSVHQKVQYILLIKADPILVLLSFFMKLYLFYSSNCINLHIISKLPIFRNCATFQLGDNHISHTIPLD